MPCSQVTPWFFFEIIEIKQFHLPLLYNLQIKYFVSSPLHTFFNMWCCTDTTSWTASERKMFFIFLFISAVFGIASVFCLCIGISCLSVEFKTYIIEKDLKKKRPNAVKAWSWRPGHLWNIEYFWWVFLSSVSSGKKGFWTMGSHANAYLTTNYLDK